MLSGFYVGEGPGTRGRARSAEETGLMYWPFVQLTNFSLVPVQWRTAYTGLCGFFWATFLCFSQQSGDGTLKSVFILLRTKAAGAVERPPEQ
ncbi:Mpv17-like protein [Fukomys damarensis]|uniref:Mpv17-like protein n=1 Tax=Fukomys damarensis TaxID=885580 RepID=A0A091CS58_FUKDA|nr:Mpv17-like protein [Fukomys damarensis]